MQWLREFFKRKSRNEEVNRSSVSPEKIIQDYGVFLDSPAAGAPGCILDAQKLPWPKEQIRQALFTALDVTSDVKMRNRLAGGLLSLSFYQVGVGKIPVGIDYSKFSHITDGKELARIMTPGLEAMRKWEPIVEAEKEEIKAMLKSHGIVLDP